MKELNLVLKAHWYDMIGSGVKTEEYRDIKDYWTTRLICGKDMKKKEFDAVTFRYGYTLH